DGPMGATGPDLITDHSFSNLQALANDLTGKQSAAGLNPAGLESAYTPFTMIYREGDPTASTSPQPIDFYSPDTFNFSSLDVSADGQTLTVTTYGVNSYATNTFPEPSAANPLREILSYSISAVPEPTSILGTLTIAVAAVLPRRHRR